MDENALAKLEFILNSLKNFEKNIPDKEFDKFGKVNYKIIREIGDNFKI